MNHAHRSDCALDQRLLGGDRSALGEALAAHRPRMLSMIRLRMDPRLRRRIDASDVIQDAYVEATTRIGEFLDKRPAPSFFLWLRFLVAERLITLSRHHLATEKRDARRETPLFGGDCSVSSDMLAVSLAGALTGPRTAAIRAESRIRLHQALDSMAPIDREIIGLRHFEQLSRTESAHVLGIEVAAASKRYVRAMKRLRSVVNGQAGGNSDVR